MAEIRQELGFDVQQAISALDQLDNRIGRLNRSLENISNGQRENSKAAQGLTISFQTLARIITTQLVVRAFGALQRALTSSITDAIEFQNVIAEIGTIDIRGGQGLGEIADDVANLSKEFGVDLGDVGRGLYQTISNQIAQTGTAAERAAGQYEFLNTAIKFGIAGVTTTESAVNLLSGTLNAFNQDVENTELIAAQFFKTIELGRTTASELANSFGTVAPIAAQLGVSIEELQASFATITISGIDTAKAATQIRGTLNALLKPTVAMKDAFEDLGVANGQQLVDLFGLQGALEAVIGTTDKSAEAVSKLVPRIRGLSGALILAGEDGAEKFRDNLLQIIEANDELLEEKFELVFDTDARQFTRDLNELKVLITRDFGEAVLSSIAQITSALGGFDNISEGFQSLINTVTTLSPVLAIGTAGVAAFGARAFFASTQVGILTKSMGLLGAVTAAIALGDFLGTQIGDLLQADNDAIDNALKQRNEFAKRQSTLRRQNEEATNKLILADFKKHLSDVAKANTGRIRDARRTLEQVRSANEDAFGSILDASRELENRLRQQFRARESQARQSVNIQKDLEQELRDQRFAAETRNLSDIQKFNATEIKLAEERQRALTLLASEATQAGDVQAIEDTREAFERVSETVRDLQSLVSGLTDTTERRTLQFAVDTEANQALRNRIALEDELLQIVDRRFAAEKKATEEVAENNRKLTNVFAELIEAQNAVAAQGADTSDQEKSLARFRELQTEFADLLRSNQDIGGRELASFSNVLTSGGFRGILEEELTGAQIKRLAITDSALEDARNKLNQAFQGLEAEIGVNVVLSLRAAGFKGEAGIDRIGEFAKTLISDDNVIRAIEEDIQVLNTQIDNAVADLEPLGQKLQEGLGAGEQLGGFAVLEDAKLALDAFNIAAEQALRDGRITFEESEQLRKLFAEARTQAVDLNFINERVFSFQFEDQLDLARQLFARVNAIKTATAQLTTETEALNRARESATTKDEAAREAAINAITSERVQDIIDAREAARQEAEQTNNVTQAATNAANAVAVIPEIISSATQEVGQLEVALNNLSAPDLSLNIGATELASTGKLINRLAKGGLPYLAGGGFSPRGTDTIPAMLSPGEFVINARSSRKFFSQLQAINAGVTPIFRQEGGPVTQFTGDINVTMSSGGESAAADGRLIARSIRRELRRGTSSL